MVLLTAVTLFSVMVAVIAGWWQDSPSSTAEAKSQLTLADPTPVRVVGVRFEPNVNPHAR
jgi:hypothetical protein